MCYRPAYEPHDPTSTPTRWARRSETDDVPRPETTAADIVALVERGGVELRTNRNDLDEINEVAERLEHGEIEGRAAIMP